MARKSKPPTDAVEITEIEMAQAATVGELWLLVGGALVTAIGIAVLVISFIASLLYQIDLLFWLFIGLTALFAGMFCLTIFQERARESVLLSRSSKKAKRKKSGTPFINAC